MSKLLNGKIDKRTWVKFFTHIIVITMLFILPDLVFSYTRTHWKPNGWHLLNVYMRAAVFVSVFYIEYYLILSKPLTARSRKIWRFVGWNLLLFVGAVIVIYLIQKCMMSHMPWHRMYEPTPMQEFLRHMSFILRDGGMVVLTMGLSFALRLGENWSMLEQRHQELLASQKTDELASLKSQLNPHFLFNTLNTIYALISVSPTQAQDAVHELSSMLRYVLYENPEKVRLSKEIEFAKNYISLMQMRLGDDSVKSEFRMDSDPEVPALIFVTLIENAFKHGNTGVKGQPIRISINSDADGNVTCRTSNHFVVKEQGDSAGEDKRRKGGIGMSNLRRRLQLIYDQDASLSTTVSGDVYQSILTIKAE